MTDAGNQTLGLGDVGQFASLRRRIGQRLFAVNMLARQKNSLGHLVMQAVRQPDVNQVNIRVLHRIAPRLQDLRPRRAKGQIGRGPGVIFDQSDNLRRAARGAHECGKV